MTNDFRWSLRPGGELRQLPRDASDFDPPGTGGAVGRAAAEANAAKQGAEMRAAAGTNAAGTNAAGTDAAQSGAGGPVEAWDLPTVASPVYTGEEKYPGEELLSQRYSPVALDAPMSRRATPTAARGTDTRHAETSTRPDDGGHASSDIEALFGEGNFVDYSDEPMIPPLAVASAAFREDRTQRQRNTSPAAANDTGLDRRDANGAGRDGTGPDWTGRDGTGRGRTGRDGAAFGVTGRGRDRPAPPLALGVGGRRVGEPRVGGSRGEMVRARVRPVRIARRNTLLLAIAASTVIVLALVALFLLGARIAGSAPTAAIASVPSPVVTSLPTLPLEGEALSPGEYRWDELMGGECVMPFESAWQESYTVVDCSEAHTAQLVARDVLGTMPEGADSLYPGVESLQATVTALCASPQVIDYALASASRDLQLVASFPADDADWASGNKMYYCFASSATGTPWQGSIDRTAG